MKYIVAIDLDNTLLNSQGVVSDENYETIQKVKEMGHEIVIATGRSYVGALDIYSQLKLDTPLITYNGASVSFPNQNILPIKTYIDGQIIKEIFNSIKSHVFTAYYTLDSVTYAYNYNAKLEHSFNGKNSPTVVEIDFTKDVHDAHLLVLSIDSNFGSSLQHLIQIKYPMLSTRKWISNNDYMLFEVYQKDISKYTGLKQVFKKLGMNENQLISFGDNENDIDMIKHAFRGIAVNNAVKELKDVAYKVSEFTNDEHAVAKYLQEIFVK